MSKPPIIMLFTLLVFLIHTAVMCREVSSSARTRVGRSVTGEEKRVSLQKQQIACDQYASCASVVEHADTCFCDPHCQLFGDCCSDFADEVDAEQLTPLPPESFVCSWMSVNDNFVIITDCPSSYSIQFVLDGCRRGSQTVRLQSSEKFYAIPVSGRTSGLVYRNVYCALCHGERDAAFWEVKTERCPSRETAAGDGVTQSADVDIEGLLRNQSFVDQCRFTYSPPFGVPAPHRCFDAIDTCPSSYGDLELAARCIQSSAVVYVFDRQGSAYRNRACAVCNGVEDYDLSCNSSTPGTRNTPPPVFGSFQLVLDLNAGKGSEITGSGGSRSQRLGSCEAGHVYDPFAGNCRVVACPFGYSFTDDGQCDSLSRPMGDRSDIYHEEDSAGRDCAWIQFGSSEYRLLSNRSIYVPLHETTYDNNSYRLGVNRTAFVCTEFQRNYTEWVYDALVVDSVGIYLSVVCSIISLLALAFQFAVYMAFPVLRNTPGRCVICLVASLFVAQLLFLLVKVGSFVSSEFCYCQAVLMHYAFLAAFFWMNVMAIDVYRTFGSSTGLSATSPSSSRRRFLRYSAYVWLSTAAVVGISVAVDLAKAGRDWRPHYGRRVCWFGSRGGLLLLFGIPVAVLLVANIIMFILSVRQIRSASKASQMAVQKSDHNQLLVIYVKLSVVMGLGWVLGFAAAFTDLTALWYIFIVVNSLQGALICVAFVATRQVLKLLVDCAPSLWRLTTTTGPGPSGSNDLSVSPMSRSAVDSKAATGTTTCSSL